MLKNAKYRYNSPACARFVALLVLLLWGLSAQAQGYFTLTNGRLWWSNGLVDQNDADWRDPVAFDEANGWAEVHPHGTDHVTHITEQGDTYLALDITTDPEHPTIVSKAHNEFDLYCVWYRTGYTGYYYQEWYNESDAKTYRYYIIANSDADELQIVRTEVGQPLEKSTYWYNWDFGAAAWETPTIDGEQKNRYYWMMLQDRDRSTPSNPITPVWKLSHHTYQRPEVVYYENYTLYGDDPQHKHYYDEVDGGADGTYPAGTAALFMPVTVKPHEDSIIAIARDENDGNKPYGLQVTFDPSTRRTLHTGIKARLTEMTYGEALNDTNTVSAVMKYKNTNTVPMDLRPAYTEYIEETYRRGIHLNYRYRNEEGVFGSAGIGTFRTHYYQGTTSLGIAPGPASMEATVDTFIFAVDSRSRRYIDVDTIYSKRSEKFGQAVLGFNTPCNGTHTVEVYVTVRYNNGTEQYDTMTITLRYTKDERIITKPTVGPVIRGAVFGGGRIANVGGSTEVVVHSADSINTIYGGNDIAGWVQGDDGATLQLGTEFTSKEHPVHIGNVYGGGNGYYVYRGINMSPITGFPYRYGSSLKYQNYYFGYHYNGHDGQPPVDTNWILNLGYPANLPTEITSNPYYLGEGTAMYHNPITQKDTLTRYYVMRRNDFCGSVYEYGHVPQIKDRHTSSFSSYDSAFLDWGPLQEYLVDGTEDICFSYNPEIGDASSVDLSEQGLGGNGTIPYIKTAHITVGVREGRTPFVCEHDNDSTHWHNDHIVIDTLFGGARNAFIGVTANEGDPENGVTIDINGGTLFAVFGGNNVGGSVANTSTVFVNIHDTKLLHEGEEVEESFLAGYGRDFGIRYLFGGGNFVDGSHANITISGGMIDTAYLGGNNATVQNPIGTVDCRKQGSTNGFGYDGHFICTNTTYPHTLNFTDPVAALDANSHFFDGYGPDHFEPEVGLYNLRCLFGGNNAADMDNLTTIQLHSGGISSVYGGGNVGDMVNNTTYDVPTETPGDTLRNQPFPQLLYNQLFNTAFDINTDGSLKPGGWADVYGRLTLPSKVGTIVTALPNSKIVCDYVYGGARIGNIKNAAGVYLAGGIYGYVTGGNDVSGDIGSENGSGVYLILDQNALVVGDAVGGSDGYYHCDDGTGHYGDGDLYDSYAEEGAEPYDPYDEYEHMLLPTHNNVNFYMRGGLVMGQIVAGGVHADVGFDQREHNYITKLTDGKRREVDIDLSTVGGEQRGTVHFMASGGRVLGNGYGGGFQSKLHGLSYLSIRNNARIDGSFFCGNDCTGSIRSFGAYMNPNDYTRHYNSLLAVYRDAGVEEDSAKARADRNALVEAYQAMKASDGTPLNIFDGFSWGAATSAYLRIKDTPYIHCVYGSGNGAYDYDGSRPEYDAISFCPDPSGSVTPLQSSTFIDINTSGVNSTVGEGIDTVFGGGNGVGVEEKVVVLLNNTERDVHAVHTIFGGNNVDDMLDVVPEIRLLKGQVNTVYAGANNGVMGAKKSSDFKDVLGKAVPDVSTHVKLNSEDVTILDTLFGGSRMSDIKGNTFVEVVNTNNGGVNYIFGGNDISGIIDGTTRIDVSGGTVHNIFGGSDGRYDFVEVGDNEYAIYPFNSVPDDSANHRITIAGYPEIDSTNINIWGGTVGTTTGGVYGGGSMADCRATCVVVNDTVGGTHGEATILGTVFGGGMGDYADLNNRNQRGERYGNVNEATHVHLHHAKELTGAKAYGGGRGGDVMNTYINTYEGWNTPFDELYGGCWGGDVHGIAHLDFKGSKLVKNLFGGNDFSGNVYKSVIHIHSGIFTNIYGAGNGYYADNAYNSGTYADDTSDLDHPVIHHIHRPNNEYVEITFDDGTVEGNLYGGGRLGSTWAYKKDANREYLLEHGHKIPDTDRTTGQAHTNPLDYAYVITNIHGGDFRNNVFGGASGRDGSSTDALVYGLKVINMDGGNVHMSLYGGSESVNDGYASECTGKGRNETTLRPSSIINMKGGIVESNLYGAGYLGTTYGSVYVNVGTDAIDSCVAYTRSYSSGGGAKSTVDSAYWVFKPGEEGSLSDALVETPVVLNHSVYAGANWGAGSGTATFTTAGFFGGESMIRIDGKGYNTGADEFSTLPQMNVKKSLFGSGTSVRGGDVRSHIDLWNYGELDNCHPTKELESVQRTNQFFSHNTAVHYLGATDATNAYISEPYTILRSDTMSFRGFNVAEYDAPISFVEYLRFYEEDLREGRLDPVPVQNLRNVPTSANACGASSTMCDFTYVVSPTENDKKHSLLVLNNGIDFKIQQNSAPIGSYYTPGYVMGFGYITTPYGYSSSVTAIATAYYYSDDDTIYSWLDEGYDWNTKYGYAGFVSPCETSNRYTTKRDGDSLVWLAPGDVGYVSSKAEYPYTNFISEELEFLSYREWKVGDGVRLRETAIRAHIDPTQLAEDVNVKIDDTELALAKATITLPPTSGGHYYKFNNDGIIISSSNSTANLVDEAWSTTTDFATLATAYPTAVDGEGSWKQADLDEGGLLTGRSLISNYPDNTFGLVLQPGENFETSAGHYVMPSLTGVTEAMSTTVLSGNSYYNASASFCSPMVAEGDRIMPTMDLLLTYSPTFSTTFLGTVEFTLDEYEWRDTNDNGVVDAGEEHKVGPVKVKAYISTIIESFRDMETSVLAMFNNNVTNTFTRRVILPITLDENRELYITSVKWEPTDGDGVSTPESEKFYLAEKEETITGATPHEVNNLFAMHLVPNDAVTGDLNENLGWTTIDKDDINIFRLARAAGAGAQKFAGDNDTVDLTKGGTTNGLRLGILDGRGSAALNVTLHFDGSRIYPAIDKRGYVGKVVLGMKWKKGENSGNYNFTINVKTRSHGDTIYLASANSVSRGGYTVKPYTENTSYYNELINTGDADSIAKAPTVIGKSPNCYVQSFQHALSSNVYQEGDVIAIMDQVNINTKPVHIQGADGPPIQVIRYDGHHHELPDEVGVYRGPMIVVSGEGKLFTAQNIDFHGSAGAKIKRVDGSNPTGFKTHHIITVGETTYDWTDTVKDRNHFEPDTNRAFGPIIAIKNNGAVTLSEGTLVRHNWNAYGSEAGQTNASGLPLSSENMGAISVTDGGTLTLKGDVTVRDNLSHTITGYDDQTPVSVAKTPGNGAIYVDGGKIVLPESHKNTAIDITRNRLMDPLVHTNPSSVRWWQMATITRTINDVPTQIPSQFTLDTTLVYTNWKKANVYLTRTAPSSGSAMEKELNDVQSDVIRITGSLGTNTRIGVRKWFPGPTTRDTMRIAVNDGYDFTILDNVYKNKNFQSDDGFRVFYNQGVNNVALYLFRCATFHHQVAGAALPLAKADGSGYYIGADVLDYRIMPGNHCPVGGDTILYRVQGGFAPYTFTWSGDVSREFTKPYSNAQISKALSEHDSSLYWSSITDTFITTYLETTREAQVLSATVNVKAVDATGYCELSKDITINARLVADKGAHQLWEPQLTDHDGDGETPARDGWKDTATVVANRVKAVGDRYLEGITITPYVYADPSYGYINAVVYNETGKHLYRYIDAEHRHELSSVLFCGGEDIHLKTDVNPADPSHQFIMWNFDPYTDNPATYVVPAHNENVIAYYAPNKHWNEQITDMTKAGAKYTTDYYYTARPSVPSYNLATGDGTTTSTEAGYVTTLNGDVHIYNENGLAWFISVVNGLNGSQARQFRFNSVYLHDKDGGYDMKNYLWTPTGTQHQPFRGWFVGVGSADTTTLPLTGSKVVIKNLIINEPEMPYTGFFGFIDTACIKSIHLQASFIRGSQYVGTLAASSKNARISDVDVSDALEPTMPEPTMPSVSPNTTTLLVTHYTSGGLIGISDHDQLSNFTSQAKYVGDAVYSGGVVGYGTSTTIENSQTRNDNSMSGLYIGGIAGYLDGTAPRKGGLFRRKSAGDPSVVRNNYVRFENSKGLRVGGLVGYAKNSILENNYFYGDVAAVDASSGVASVLEGGSADGNYYQLGSAERAVATSRGDATLKNTATFAGKGNQVTLAQYVHGRNNLTRVLNAWVREHNANGGSYMTWRSDLEGVNGNFPLFGVPDLIPVNATATLDGCGEVLLGDIVYTSDTVVTSHVVDSIEMIDSTLTATIRLHYGTEIFLSDSASLDEGYYDNGFALSSYDLQSLEMTHDSAGHSLIILHDTLSTAYGCDSVVTLTLVFANGQDPNEEGSKVNAYPNPTISVVYVEADGMSHVEVYDNEGRRLQDYDATNTSKITVDMRPYPSGIYFIRVHMPKEVVIQKIIKQR